MKVGPRFKCNIGCSELCWPQALILHSVHEFLLYIYIQHVLLLSKFYINSLQIMRISLRSRRDQICYSLDIGGIGTKVYIQY